MTDAHSARNLRLALAVFGAVVSLVLGGLTLRAFGVGPSVFLFVLGVIAVVDAVVVQRRRAERRRRHAGADHQHDSLFE